MEMILLWIPGETCNLIFILIFARFYRISIFRKMFVGGLSWQTTPGTEHVFVLLLLTVLEVF